MVHIGICVECGKEDEIHARGKCYKCYKKTYKQPIITCKICGKKTQHHAKGLCGNCAQKLFYYENIKTYNVMKYHGLDLKTWRDVTKKCMICGFDKIVDLHHLDGNRKNTSRDNLIGLCPNHHRMAHDMRFREEIDMLLSDIVNRRKFKGEISDS